jgi:hypothetical protein
MKKISLILIGYSHLRYKQIKNICDLVLKSDFHEAFDIFICLDGLKVNSSKKEIIKRSDFKKWINKKNITVLERDHNLGSKKGIIINYDTLKFFCKYLRKINSVAFKENTVGFISAYSCLRWSNKSSYHFSWQGPSWGWGSSRAIFSEFMDWKENFLSKKINKYQKKQILDCCLMKIPIFSRGKFKKIISSILDGKITNWDLTFRVFLLSKSYITLRTNTPLVDNIGYGQDSQHHKNKSLIHMSRINYMTTKNYYLLKLKVSPIWVDFFQPWLPKQKFARLIIKFLHNKNFISISESIYIV